MLSIFAMPRSFGLSSAVKTRRRGSLVVEEFDNGSAPALGPPNRFVKIIPLGAPARTGILRFALSAAPETLETETSKFSRESVTV